MTCAFLQVGVVVALVEEGRWVWLTWFGVEEGEEEHCCLRGASHMIQSLSMRCSSEFVIVTVDSKTSPESTSKVHAPDLFLLPSSSCSVYMCMGGVVIINGLVAPSARGSYATCVHVDYLCTC